MAHGHVEVHGEVEGGGGAKSAASPQPNMSDKWFEKIQDYLTGGISRFVGFLFFLITAGAILGYVVAQRGEGEILILIPAAAGLLAYFNRDFAVAVLGFVVLLIIL